MKLLNGHRAIIGYTLKSIRQSGGFELATIAKRCRLEIEDMRFYEDRGFMERDDEYQYCYLTDESSSMRPIYLAWLKGRVLHDYFESDDISFESISQVLVKRGREIQVIINKKARGRIKSMMMNWIYTLCNFQSDLPIPML